MASNLCRLCKSNPADKKNSHIIPFFLIKSIVTPNELKRTEKDISFDLTNPSLVEYFLGRDVQPEKITEILGREMSEEEIEKNKNPFTIDNFICSSCEIKLSRLESLFSDRVFSSLPSRLTKVEFFTLDEEDTLLLKLFVYSIIWRVGEAKHNQYSMAEPVMKKLSKLLNQNLSANQTEIIKNIKANINDVNRHKVSISHFKDPELAHGKFVFFLPTIINPYIFFIDGFTIFFSYKKKSLLKKGSAFLGLEKVFDRKQIHNSNNAIIYKESKAQILSSIDQMMTLITVKKVKKLRADFDEVYQTLRGVRPNYRLANAYINELTNGKYDYIDRLGLQRIAQLMGKYCKL